MNSQAPVSSKLTISLVIPAYNEEKYIKDCLLSAKENSNGLLHEIIVVDNASTDKTAEVASGLPDVLVLREEKKGTSAARQKGFENSTGDIVAFIDADTRMPKGWCETVLKEFSDPKLAALSGPYRYYDLPGWKKPIAKVLGFIVFWPAYKMTRYMAMGGNLAMRRSVLEQMGGLDTSITFYGDDTDMVRRASKFGKIKFKMSFTIDSSARRFHGQGPVNTLFHYFINFGSQVIMKKSVTKEYTDVR